MSDDVQKRADQLAAELASNGFGSGSEGEDGAEQKPGKSAGRKKGGKKRWVLFALPVLALLIGGGTYATLVATGKLKSPLIAKKATKQDTPVKPVAPTPTPAPSATESPDPGPTAEEKQAAIDQAKRKADQEKKAKQDAALAAAEAGAKRLSRAWETMEPEAVAKIAASYDDKSLARVLTKMDAEKVGAILAAVDPKRAAKISKVIESQIPLVAVN